MKSKVHHDGQVIGEFESTGDFAQDQAIVERMFREAGHASTKRSRVELVECQAEAFATIAFELFNKAMLLKEDGFVYAITCVVNATFGIELYLKALAMKHGKELRGHKLLDLYGALPDIAKDRIDIAANTAAKRYDLPLPLDVPLFLNGLNDVYSTWRYAYEGRIEGEVGITQALLLLDALSLALNSK